MCNIIKPNLDICFSKRKTNTFTIRSTILLLKKKENDFIMASLLYIPVVLASNLFSSLKKVLTTKIAQILSKILSKRTSLTNSV